MLPTIGVMDAVARFMVWNFEILHNGYLPERGFYNEPWSCPERARMARERAPLFGEYRGKFAGWKGDLKARKECHNTTAWYQARAMCDGCLAVQPFASVLRDPNKRRFCYTDFSAGAPWRATNGLGEGMRHSGWRAIRGWHDSLVHWDLMHNGPHGVWRNLCGGVVMDMLRRGETRYLQAARALNALRLIP